MPLFPFSAVVTWRFLPLRCHFFHTGRYWLGTFYPSNYNSWLLDSSIYLGTTLFPILKFSAVVIPGYKRKPAYFKADSLKFMILCIGGLFVSPDNIFSKSKAGIFPYMCYFACNQVIQTLFWYNIKSHASYDSLQCHM